MIDVRIICTYDAVKTAQTLARVLSAEGRNVDVNFGRAALALIEQSRARDEGVLLIWSLDAQSAHYMLHWQGETDPSRLIEVSRGPGYPPLEKRRAPVIDFTSWNGQRGGHAWRALQERLRAVDRLFEPARPAQRQAAVAVGALSALAVVSALVVRIQEALQPPTPPPSDTFAGLDSSMDGLGGPLHAIEPASMHDEIVTLGPVLQVEALAPAPPGVMLEAELADPIHARDMRLLERLEALAEPLFQREEQR